MMWRVSSSKTDKTRKIPIRLEVADLARKLMKTAPKGSGLPLFRTIKGRPWQQSNGVVKFIAIRKKLGWDKDPVRKQFSCYACRHTFAHRMLSAVRVLWLSAGLAWAIAGDHRASTTRKTPGAETESPTRQPWAAYGMLAASGGLFLISAQMAIAGPESAEEPGGVAGVTGLLLAIAGSFVFLYGLLDKYVHRRADLEEPGDLECTGLRPPVTRRAPYFTSRQTFAWVRTWTTSFGSSPGAKYLHSSPSAGLR